MTTKTLKLQMRIKFSTTHGVIQLHPDYNVCIKTSYAPKNSNRLEQTTAVVKINHLPIILKAVSNSNKLRQAKNGASHSVYSNSQPNLTN